MPNNPTKYYSNKQETMIAQYLGWDKVVASGARACLPGDIKSDTFLGECKTHTSLQSKVVFNVDHWSKLNAEASFCHKYPVMFSDDGSQLSENTWCIFPDKMICPEDYNSKPLPVSVRTNISFDNEKLKARFEEDKRSVSGTFAYTTMLNGRSVGLTRLSEFYEMFERWSN